ncbi:MAG TPA: acetamidase/formamidase family protein [Trueperaceae bacterium]
MTSFKTIHDRHHHFGWDNSIEPVIRVEAGAELEVGTVDASGGQLTADSTTEDVARLDFERVNPVTGPVYVDGAQPGDALEVEILGFEENSWGWTALIPGFGLLADEFPDPFLHISRYDGRSVRFTDEIELPFRPFPGTIGVAPAQKGLHSVVPPRHVGGNLDIRDLTIGSKLYLPVEVPGALFSVGDTHAAQGDGEVCGTAIETAMKIRVRLSVKKGTSIPTPQYDVAPGAHDREGAKGFFVTTGVAPDLMAAARDAVRSMIEHMGREYALELQLAYALCSVAVNLKISEVVDAPNWVVSACLPKGIFR